MNEPGPDPFDAHARTILRARYLLRDEAGEPTETPAELLRRVARAVAQPEARWGHDPEQVAGEFHALLADLRFLPNSPTLMNAGRPRGQLSACFVLPVEDSLSAIFGAVADAAHIHQTGGGTGFSFSRLRPKGDLVGTRAHASGPVAFMKVFDSATGVVPQGGVRRGANMGILRVDHPDVREFIHAKSAPGTLSHFNISLAVTDAFWEALESGGDYALVHPTSGAQVARLSAPQVWDELCAAAHATGDPGLVFIDRINALQPTPQLGPIESTNPCGELPLLPFESCNLGSIDVAKHARPDGSDLAWDALRATIHLAVRFLDDVIEASTFPLERIDAMTKTTRKIGLGIMGWADLLVRLGLPYASEEALALADRLAAFLLAEGRAASRALAGERGPFPAWVGSRWKRELGGEPLRNATVTTIAPTGTISLLAGCSSGIEPHYALSYVRRALDGQTQLEVFLPAVEELARAHGVWSEELRRAVQTQGTLAGVAGVPADLARLFQTAHEIPPEWHVRTQAAFQAHVENAVSKTVNLPRDATPADVDRIYRLAYELGCKGITVYRDGSHGDQVLATQGACGGPECHPA